MARVLTAQADGFPRRDQDLIAKAKPADNGPVRGTMPDSDIEPNLIAILARSYR